MPAVTTVSPTSDGATVAGSQKELVQKWVDSITSHDGSETGDAMVARQGSLDAAGEGKLATDNEDDLTLGAEARMLQNDLHTVEAAAPAGAELARPETLKYSSILRQRFALKAESSFNSDSSRHSIEQLLNEHRVDPERVLANLGFVNRSKVDAHQVPDHFLCSPSRASGISVEDYLSQNPKLRRRIERKMALQNTFQAMAASGAAAAAIAATATDAGQGQESSECPALNMQAFSQVAQTVTLINRFRSRALNRQSSVLAEPILRTSSIGSQYWSILEEENSLFLEKVGFYNGTAPPANKSACKAGAKRTWAVARSAALSKLHASTNGTTEEAPLPPQVTEQPTASLPLPPSFPVAEDSGVVNSVTPLPLTLDPDSSFDLPSRQLCPSNIPARFLSSPSTCPVSAQPFMKSPFLHMSHDVEPLVSQLSVEHAAAECTVPIPTIEINNNDAHRGIGRLSDQSGFEWCRSSSVSSSTTDDILSPSSDDSYLERIRAIRAMRATSSTEEEADRLGLLAVPSDAASTVSSHTLVEQDTGNEVLSIDVPDDGSKSSQLECNVGGRTRSPLDRFRSLQEGNSFDIEEVDSNTDTCNENHQPLSLPARIRCVLRRQGSSQSDSSGFADTDQVESLPPTTTTSSSSHNKTYLRRLGKPGMLTSRSFTVIEPLSDDTLDTSDVILQSAPVAVDHSQSTLLQDSESRTSAGVTNEADVSVQCNLMSRFDQMTQTEWNEQGISQRSVGISSDAPPSSSRFISCGTETDDLLDAKSSRTYTTRMYIDSPFPAVHIPLVERNEVTVVVGKKDLDHVGRKYLDHDVYSLSSSSQSASSSKSRTESLTSEHLPFSKRFLTTVDVQSGTSAAGQLTLMPTNSRSVEVIVGQRKDAMPSGSFGNMLPRRSAEDVRPGRRTPLRTPLRRCKSFNITDHQILHSLVNHSVFVSPQTLAYLIPPCEWFTLPSSPSSINTNQGLVEEVKLLQQALAKYRLEMKMLAMRTHSLYNDDDVGLVLAPEERQELSELSSLRDSVTHEVEKLDMLLSQRMRFVVGGASDHDQVEDLGQLGVVHDMTELLNEQLYHGNIVSGLNTSLPVLERHSYQSLTRGGICATLPLPKRHVLSDTNVARSVPMSLSSGADLDSDGDICERETAMRPRSCTQPASELSPSLAERLLNRMMTLEQRISEQQLSTTAAVSGMLQQGAENVETKKKKRHRWPSFKPPWTKK